MAEKENIERKGTTKPEFEEVQERKAGTEGMPEGRPRKEGERYETPGTKAGETRKLEEED